MLHVSLLGPPTVTWQGQVVMVPRKSVRALLYVLAAREGALARDKLAHLLHADADAGAGVGADQALARVRIGLAQLRDALAAAGAPKDLVIATPQAAELSARVVVDARRIDALARQRAPFTDDDVEFLQRAYTGDFLAGFALEGQPEFDMWLSAERERCLRAYIDAAQRCAASMRAQRRHQPARDLALNLVRIDPLNEEANALLIDCHRELGERSAAIRQYEQLRANLARELGVAPLPETEARYRLLLNPGTVSAAAQAEPPEPPEAPRAAALPFVGRADELARMRAAWQRALSGRPQVLVLSGDAGAGKTRLAEEFVAAVTQAAPTGPIVLRAHGYASTQSTPYYALNEALRAMLTAMSSRAGGRTPNGRAWKTGLLNALLRRDDAPPTTASRRSRNESEARDAQWSAALRGARLLSRRRPLLVLGDDMQWCDSETLLLLAHVLRRLRRAPVLALFTVRDGPAQFLDLAHEWSRDAAVDVTRVPVGALSLPDLRELLSRADAGLEHSRREALAQALLDETEGNAFFAAETLRSWLPLRAPAASAEKAPPRGAPSVAIRAFVDNRFARLSQRARQVLGAAAVVGRSVTHELLRQVSGRAEGELADALDELIAARIIRDGEQLRFAHSKYQEAAYDGLSVARRRLLHARAAQALMAEPDPEAFAFEIVAHAERGKIWRAEPAADSARWYALAGRAAQHACVTTRSVELYRKALAALGWRGAAYAPEAPALTPGLSAEQTRIGMEALAGLGEMLRWHADYVGALDAFAAFGALADASGDALSAARALQGAAFVLNYKGDHAGAIARAQRAAELARPLLAHDILAATSYDQGWAHFRLGQYLQALECAGRTIALSEARRDDYQLSLGYNLLGVTYNNLGDFAQARAAHERGLALCRSLNLRARMMSVLTNLGELARAQADYGEAALRHGEALNLARAMDSREMRRLASLNLGASYVGQGRAAEAEAYLRDALALIDAQGWTGESEARCHLAEALSRQGRGEAAVAEAERALALAQATGRPANLAEAWYTLGVVFARGGCAVAHDPDASFAESARIYRQHHAPAPLARALNAWSLHAARRGDVARAAQLRGDAARIAAQIGLTLPAAI